MPRYLSSGAKTPRLIPHNKVRWDEGPILRSNETSDQHPIKGGNFYCGPPW
jgi:hypothetical protein